MVWKKDLAKIKQILDSEEEKSPRPPIPKATPKPSAPLVIEEEDALFLNAMGHRPRTSQPVLDIEVVKSEAIPASSRNDQDTNGFQEAMASLKGLKPAQPPVKQSEEKGRTSKPTEAISQTAPVCLPDPPEPPAVQLEAPIPEPIRKTPALIHLAAGMAIEVNGKLDLRGHSPVDAMERLRERVMDAHLLGWRTFHILLGSSEELKSAFMEFLASPGASSISRYAQAPIPMGGSHAWILYFAGFGPIVH